MYNLLQIILKITMHEKKRQAGSRKEKETACGRLLWYTVAMMRYQNKEENGMVLFVEYPKCTTCRKAKKWLEEKGIKFEDRDIREQNPSAEELQRWHGISGLPLKCFFNTSGQLYREMNLKDRLPSMTEEEQYRLLASDGMLVKRPIIVSDDFVLVGFKEAEWSERLG